MALQCYLGQTGLPSGKPQEGAMLKSPVLQLLCLFLLLLLLLSQRQGLYQQICCCQGLVG